MGKINGKLPDASWAKWRGCNVGKISHGMAAGRRVFISSTRFATHTVLEKPNLVLMGAI